MKNSSSMKPGDVVGDKYRLVQPIGEGNMGAVWQANFITFDKPVALKFVIDSTRDLRHRLLREAMACGTLSHPNIVQLFDVGTTDSGDPFLVLELLAGETLGQMIKSKRRIAAPIAARIARDIASALAAAHKAKFIHRDLKPANVFLHREPGLADGEFIVKVLDFGVSKHLEATNESLVTASGAAVGSPAYMSPEQVCVRKDIDHRTDIWSLGVVFYEMLTGARPFDGAVDQVVRNILLAEIVPPSNRVRSLPPEFDEIVNRCLERDRGKRIAHAEDLVRILAPFAEASRSSYAPPARVSDSGRPSAMPTVEATPIAEDTERRKPAEKPQLQFTPTGTQLLPKTTQGAVVPEKPPVSTTGTAVLDPKAHVGDPFAALRQERQQALAAYRQSEPLVQGGTMAVSPDLLEKATSGVPLDGINSGLASQSTEMVVTKDSAPINLRRRKHSGRAIVVSISIGIVAGISLVGVLVAIFLSREKEASRAAVASSTSEHVSVPEVAEVAPRQVVNSVGVTPAVESAETSTISPNSSASAAFVQGNVHKASEARKVSPCAKSCAQVRSTGGKKNSTSTGESVGKPSRLFGYYEVR